MSNAIGARAGRAEQEKFRAMCYTFRPEAGDDMSTEEGKAGARRRSTEIADRYGRVRTAIGDMWVSFSSRGIRMIRPGDRRARDFESAFRRRFGRRPVPAAVPARYARMIRDAAAGRPYSKPEVDLSGLRPFEIRVLGALRRIPRGALRTYGWLARRAGSPGAARAVGNVMARNPVPLLLPCHRVVPARGGPGGYAFGPALKRALLRKEGVRPEELKLRAAPRPARHGER